MPEHPPDLASLLTAVSEAAARHDLTEAATMAQRAAADYPNAPAPLFLLCRLMLEHRDPRSVALLPRLERYPSYAPGWEAIGGALLRLGQHEAARLTFARATTHDKTRADAWLGQAAALEAMGRHGEAAEALATAEIHQPDSWDLPYRRGLCLRQARLLAAACRAFEQAVARNTGLSAAWYALGLTRQDLRDHAGAATAYRAALAARTDFHEAALNLGTALQDAGDWEAAFAAYARAYRLHPMCFGRIAQSVTTARVGRLFLDPEILRGLLACHC